MRRLTQLSSVLLFSPIVYYCSTVPSNHQDFSFIDYCQYHANNPIQDRLTYAKLNSIKGYTASVFDGHGGDLLSDFAHRNINQYLDRRLKENQNSALSLEQMIALSLTQAYTDIQNNFFSIFKQNIHNKEYQRVGSCALTAVILKQSIHIANSGDCEGIIIGEHQPIKTNKRLNAGQPQQKQRLKRQFPRQSDIVSCHQGTNYCYVKGRLQPTRSLGDYYLKFKQYNFTRLAIFTGPYIDYRPLITHFKISSKNKKLVLATDGMWDQLDENDVNAQYKKKGNLADNLFQRCLESILKRNYLTYQRLNKIHNRRNLHDDISIIAIDLHQLTKTL